MLQASWKDRDGVLWIELEGEMDFQDCLEIREQFDGWVDKAEGDVVVVLAGVTFLSSMGLGMLVRARGVLDEKGHKLRLSGVPSTIRKILDETNLTGIFVME